MDTEWISDLFYIIIIRIIKQYKSLEVLILSLFYPIVKSRLQSKFQQAGIDLNGNDDIGVHIKPGYEKEWILRVAADYLLALGDLYAEQKWECKSLYKFHLRMNQSGMYREATSFKYRLFNYFQYDLFDKYTPKKSKADIQAYYDLGDEFFGKVLDKRMLYSCAYWKTATNLDDAQLDKMELIAQKLKLTPGMTVLELGCGWGTLAYYLAKNYGVSVVGITLSEQGIKFGREICKDLPIEFKIEDYRQVTGKFDRIVCMEMMEHIGRRNYRTLFAKVNECLKDDGLFLLHVIQSNDSEFECRDPVIREYFSSTLDIPYYLHLMQAIEGLLVIEDQHNFGSHLTKTYVAWQERFNLHRNEFLASYGEKYVRMHDYALQFGEAADEARLWTTIHYVMSKRGIIGGYEAVR